MSGAINPQKSFIAIVQALDLRSDLIEATVEFTSAGPVLTTKRYLTLKEVEKMTGQTNAA